jgi:hypothetical protein
MEQFRRLYASMLYNVQRGKWMEPAFCDETKNCVAGTGGEAGV